MSIIHIYEFLKKNIYSKVRLMLCLTLLFSIIYYFLNLDHFYVYNSNENTETSFTYLDALYYSTVNGVTIGYGDIYPKTDIGKCVVTIQLLLILSIIFW